MAPAQWISARFASAGYLLVLVGALGAAASVNAQDTVSAVYKAKDLHFYYRSQNAAFPCGELSQRIARILRGVGARDDLQINVTNCSNATTMDRNQDPFLDRENPLDDIAGRNRSDPFTQQERRHRGRRAGREQNAHVRIRAMVPVAVTPQVLEELDKDKSRRALVARATGNTALAMNDAIIFPAARQEVTLSRQTLRLDPEDCELLEQMQRTVLRDIDVKVVKGWVSCDSAQPSRIPPQLTIQALLPVVGTVKQPKIGDEESEQGEQSAPQPKPENKPKVDFEWGVR